MQATRQRDTKCEMLIRRSLWSRGLRYRVDLRVSKTTLSRPDIVFPRVKLAIFVNGCYWHACPVHRSTPKTNAQWWAEKFETNRARDLHTDTTLRQEGWTVIRAWEHEDPSKVSDRIEAAIEKLRRAM